MEAQAECASTFYFDMQNKATFPTSLHQQAATVVLEQYRRDPRVEAVLVVNSCARGQATSASDLDMLVLVEPGAFAAYRAELEAAWLELRGEHPVLRALGDASRFSAIHLDFDDGQFPVPDAWDDGGGPDDFDLAIGNAVAYSAPLWERSSFYTDLRARWLPFYAEPLRQERLAMVLAACQYDLSFIPSYVERGLYFQAFDRLYKAFREFLQGLFIARSTYALAYNKWIRMQVAEWLGLPELYAELPAILEISRLESDQLVERGVRLANLADRWVRP